MSRLNIYLVIPISYCDQLLCLLSKVSKAKNPEGNHSLWASLTNKHNL